MRRVRSPVRWLLVPFVGLAVVAGSSLTLAAGQTDDFFAWTIQPPLTAALLGAAYAGTIVFFLLALREDLWANARFALSAPLALSTLTLVATLLHLDKFHLDADPVPATVAWIWLIVYLVVPPALVVSVVVHQRAPGADPTRAAPLPLVLRLLLAAFGIKTLLLGLALFVAPQELAPHWPWAISDLTGRALAAWLVGLAVAALHVALENDLRRARAGLPSLAVIGLLGLIAVGRYQDDVDWGWGGALLVAFLASLVILGALGTVLERRHAP